MRKIFFPVPKRWNLRKKKTETIKQLSNARRVDNDRCAFSFWLNSAIVEIKEKHNFLIFIEMRIGINAAFLRKQNTGIGQVTANFLKKIAEFSMINKQFSIKELEFVLYLEEDVDLELPANAASLAVKFTKKVFLPKWYRRDDLIRKVLWEKFLLPRKASQDGCEVFLSLYQCPTIMPSKIFHIMVAHDLIPRLFPEYLDNFRKKLYQWLSERGLKKADKLLAVSHRTEKDLIAQLGIAAGKITVSYVDVDQLYKKEVDEKVGEAILKKYGLEAGYIYTGGGLEVRKNTENVLRAYKILLEAYGHASWLPKLVVSGKMMPELAPLITDVEAVVQGLGLEKEVRLLGFVPQEDLPALYAKASVFVYPSLYEGFGLPVLEALNQGKAVITSKTSSLPEVGVDAVVYCNPNDVEDLSRVLKNVLTNEHLRSTLEMKAKERATHFSWDKFVEKFLNVVRNLKSEK